MVFFGWFWWAVLRHVIIVGSLYIHFCDYVLCVGSQKYSYIDILFGGCCEMSWLEEQERILSITEVPHREPMRSIKCYFFYINMNDYIDKIDMEELELNGGDSSVLDSGTVLKIIQSKKVFTVNSKYVFKDLFMYHVDLEPDQIQSFVDFSGDLGEFSSKFFRKVSCVDDIAILPSIPVFHSVNGLYFFFHETFLRKAREPKSILKSGGCGAVGGAGVGPTRKKMGGSLGSKTTRKVGWKTI